MKTNDTHESVSRIAGRGLVLVGLLAVALALAASSFAQSNAATAPKVADAKAAQPSANSLTAEAAKAPRGTGRRNPNPRLVDHRDTEPGRVGRQACRV